MAGVSPLPPTGTLQQAYLHAGHLVVSREPCRVTTILGSCVAVGALGSHVRCRRGQSLPAAAGPDESARFGNIAVRSLIREVVARRRAAAPVCRPSCSAAPACCARSRPAAGHHASRPEERRGRAADPARRRHSGRRRGRRGRSRTQADLPDARRRGVGEEPVMEPSYIDRDELLQIFSAESEENLREMEVAFVQLESTPEDEETLQAIFRAAHTIKGNAAGLGFPALAKFAHARRGRARPAAHGRHRAHHAAGHGPAPGRGRAAPARDRRRQGPRRAAPRSPRADRGPADRGRRSGAEGPDRREAQARPARPAAARPPLRIRARMAAARRRCAWTSRSSIACST